MPERRKYLVVATCGKRSPQILNVLAKARQYDIALINYAVGDASYAHLPVEYYYEHRGQKWHNIKGFFDKQSPSTGLLSTYDYFWFPDDDILTTSADVDRMFHLVQAKAWQLAQPSLSVDSYYSWEITRHKRWRSFIHTNFVEIMCPLFSRGALHRCLPTFELCESGWGLDLIWPRLLPRRKVGILNAIQVRHTQPVGSASWRLQNGKTPEQEKQEILRIFGLASFRAREIYL